MYIRSITLTDLRAFRKAKLEFLYPTRKLATDPFEAAGRKELDDPKHGNINVVLGVNGSGKSTVLDAIAAALQSPIPQNGLRLGPMIRRASRGEAPQSAAIKLELECEPIDIPTRMSKKRFRETLACTVVKEGDHEFLTGPAPSDERFKQLFIDRSPAFLLLGYGVFRRIESLSQGETLQKREQSRTARVDRVVTLFDDAVALVPMSSWFRFFPGPKERREEIIRLINRVTPDTVKFEGRFEGAELVFKYRGLELPFTALSDGYRGHLGWVGDMLFRMHEVAPAGEDLSKLRGVVLVDEIDAHLHPAWQQEIIGKLAKAFPNIQFIFTTHSPLIAGTLERANINVVTRKGAGAPVVEPPEAEMFGLSADQILTADLFGLNSTREAGFAAELKGMQENAVTGGAKVALEFMRKAELGKAAEQRQEVGVAVPDWLVAMSSTRG